jgi:hypothetical protein
LVVQLSREKPERIRVTGEDRKKDLGLDVQLASRVADALGFDAHAIE